jgi:hypothetical protein
MKLSALWQCLTGENATHELDGWAWLLRNHLDRIAEALGPSYGATKIAFDHFCKAATVARSRKRWDRI